MMRETTSASKYGRNKKRTDNLISLYRFAEQEGIDIDWVPMRRAESLSGELPDGSCCIVIDPRKVDTTPKELVVLGHEVGHCTQGAFYNKYAACDVIEKHENKAWKWAIKKLIPEDKLDEAVAEGYTEIWSLAEHFGVTEDFMKKAVCWYTYGTLAADLYF